MKKGKTLELREDFRRGSGSSIRVASARGVMFVEGAAKAPFAINASNAESGNPSSERFFVDLDEKADVNSSTGSR